MAFIEIYLLIGLIIAGFCFSIATRIGTESKWVILIIAIALFPAWLTIAITLAIILLVGIYTEDRKRRKTLKIRGNDGI